MTENSTKRISGVKISVREDLAYAAGVFLATFLSGSFLAAGGTWLWWLAGFGTFVVSLLTVYARATVVNVQDDIIGLLEDRDLHRLESIEMLQEQIMLLQAALSITMMSTQDETRGVS